MPSEHEPSHPTAPAPPTKRPRDEHRPPPPPTRERGHSGASRNRGVLSRIKGR